MKFVQTVILVLLMSTLLSCNHTQDTNPIKDFSKLLQSVPENAKLTQDGYYVWGGSVVKVDNKQN